MPSALGTENFQVRAQEHSTMRQSKRAENEKTVYVRLKTTNGKVYQASLCHLKYSSHELS